MLGSAAPARFHLRDAPLAQALVQVKFPLLARLETLAGVSPLQDRLADLFPYMNQQKVGELQVSVTPSGMVPQSSTTTVTEFSDDDGWRLSVAPGEATLTAGSVYEGVQDLAVRFRATLVALHEDLGIRRCERLGTRFLNIVELAAGDEWAWTKWFRPEVCGWATKEALADDARLLTTITETRLARPSTIDAPGDVQSVVRHGFVPAGTLIPTLMPAPMTQPSFILDLDVFVQAPQRFEPDTLLTQFSDMHGDIERFFYWALTDMGKQHFGLEHSD
jgi:uncharacterized protein (TIGR04255 family)